MLISLLCNRNTKCGSFSARNQTLNETIIFVFSPLGFHPDVPSYPFDEKFDNFAFNCLLTREEAIVAMAKVRSECNKVAGMSVFQVPVSKSMKLEEFEQTQAQVSTQVQLYICISEMKSSVKSYNNFGFLKRHR